MARPVTRYAILLAALLALGGGIYAKGRVDGREASEATLRAAVEAQREATAKLEATRLAAQAERDRMTRQLEDAANADPVSDAVALPAGRVRRLNAIR